MRNRIRLLKKNEKKEDKKKWRVKGDLLQAKRVINGVLKRCNQFPRFFSFIFSSFLFFYFFATKMRKKILASFDSSFFTMRRHHHESVCPFVGLSANRSVKLFFSDELLSVTSMLPSILFHIRSVTGFPKTFET